MIHNSKITADFTRRIFIYETVEKMHFSFLCFFFSVVCLFSCCLPVAIAEITCVEFCFILFIIFPFNTQPNFKSFN